MEFVDSLEFGTASLDWQSGIDTDRLRRGRAARMQSIMAKEGIPALLASGESNIRYLTGVRGPEFAPQLWFVLFPAEGKPVLFQHAGYVTQQADHTPWIEEIRPARSWLRGIAGPEATREEAALFAADILAELKRWQLEGEQLAVVGIDEPGKGALRDAGVDLADGSRLMREATKIKLPEEVQCIQMASAISDRMWVETVSEIRPGMTEWELANVARAAGYEGGAENVRVGYRSGPLSRERGARGTGQFINAGEVVYGNTCGSQYMGYKICIYRTLFVGAKVPGEVRSAYAKLLDRLRAVMGALEPGATSADAAQHFPPASTWDFDEEFEVLTMEIGHGIGINSYETPAVNRQWSLAHPQEIEPGMVIAVEGRERAGRYGGVRLENMVYVTEDGPRLIDRFPSEEVLPVWDF
jgi:Xaa-Pro aminopeptidase